MNRKLTTIRVMALAAVASGGIIFAGCGGSGSPATSGFPNGGSAANVPVGPGVDGGSAMRLMANGDSYVYKVTGATVMEYLDAAFAKRTLNANVTGNMVRNVTATTYNATACFQITDSLVYTPTGGNPVSEITERFVTQAADGTITVIGQRDHSVSFNATTPQSVWSGTFATGTGLSSTSRFANDAAEFQADKVVDSSFTMVGQESLPASSGAFTTWRANWASHDETNIYPIPRVISGIIIPKGFVSQVERSETGTEWWLPSFSAPVKTALNIAENDTVITSWTFSSGTFTRSDDVLHSMTSLVMTLQAKTLN